MSAALTLPAAAFLAGDASGRRAPHKPMNEVQFEAFYRQTAGGLWSYGYKLTGNAATADDLLQKAFFRFLRSNPALTDDDHMRRYLYRTATNLALDHFRKSKRERNRDEAAPPRPESVTERHDMRHDMTRLFGELKPRERALLWLAHVEEADHNEIGAALGLKSKSVRVLLFRARKRLAEVLTRHGFGPEVAR
jgi:RNA polymerase sigma-70 factor (ECF subfamily)